MPKVKKSILELPIHVYTPVEKGRKCIAEIGNLPMVFRGQTSECARAAADAWRHEEVAKLKASEAKRKAGLAKAAATRHAKKEQAK